MNEMNEFEMELPVVDSTNPEKGKEPHYVYIRPSVIEYEVDMDHGHIRLFTAADRSLLIQMSHEDYIKYRAEVLNRKAGLNPAEGVVVRTIVPSPGETFNLSVNSWAYVSNASCPGVNQVTFKHISPGWMEALRTVGDQSILKLTIDDLTF